MLRNRKIFLEYVGRNGWTRSVTVPAGDVVSAGDSGLGNGVFQELVDWMDAAAAVVPRP